MPYFQYKSITIDGIKKDGTKGFECGLQIENYNDVKEDDTLEFYVMEEVKR